MMRATLIAILVVLLSMPTMAVDTGDTGNTDAEYVTYYRGSSCIKSVGCHTTSVSSRVPASVALLLIAALLLVALARHRRY